MRNTNSLSAQFRSLLPALGLILVIAGLALAAILFLHGWKGAAIGELTRDPAGITHTPIYTGFLSNFGILAWSTAAALCLFSARLVARR